jgi:hypothetical protein
LQSGISFEENKNKSEGKKDDRCLDVSLI